jgi:hypothetical protein
LPAFEGRVSCRAEHTPSVTQPIAGNFGHLRDVMRAESRGCKMNHHFLNKGII